VSGRQYRGPAIDGTVQHLSEAPHWQGDGETVDVVDDTPIGEETIENVPVPDKPDVPDQTGRTTFDDWGRSR
jgi:hypothetical protein